MKRSINEKSAGKSMPSISDKRSSQLSDMNYSQYLFQRRISVSIDEKIIKRNVFIKIRDYLSKKLGFIPKHFDKIFVNFGRYSTQNSKFGFSRNEVQTTKYNLITWAPKSLMLQFLRAANIYFLIITVLTSLSFSPKKPESQILTFCTVLLFSMIKDAYEVIKILK